MHDAHARCRLFCTVWPNAPSGPACSRSRHCNIQPFLRPRVQVEISHLAQDALALDRLSPQAWCVMGNCFSLQKEHELAIKFFQRALQLDPTFTYVYTLCGHEYFANEDFDKATLQYRRAMAHDKRHYNAWCALRRLYVLLACKG